MNLMNLPSPPPVHLLDLVGLQVHSRLLDLFGLQVC
jgi:hypothetical protein